MGGYAEVNYWQVFQRRTVRPNVVKEPRPCRTVDVPTCERSFVVPDSLSSRPLPSVPRLVLS